MFDAFHPRLEPVCPCRIDADRHRSGNSTVKGLAEIHQAFSASLSNLEKHVSLLEEFVKLYQDTVLVFGKHGETVK